VRRNIPIERKSSNDAVHVRLEGRLCAGVTGHPFGGGPLARVAEHVEELLTALQGDDVAGALRYRPWQRRLPGEGANASRPVGLQLMSNYFDEARLLGIAHQYQLATDWHRRVPAAFAG